MRDPPEDSDVSPALVPTHWSYSSDDLEAIRRAVPKSVTEHDAELLLAQVSATAQMFVRHMQLRPGTKPNPRNEIKRLKAKVEELRDAINGLRSQARKHLREQSDVRFRPRAKSHLSRIVCVTRLDRLSTKTATLWTTHQKRPAAVRRRRIMSNGSSFGCGGPLRARTAATSARTASPPSERRAALRCNLWTRGI